MKKYLQIAVIFCFWFPSLVAQEWEENSIVAGISLVNDINHADMDGDEDEDIVFATRTIIGWLENDGTGQFLRKHITMEEEGRYLVPEDIDGDGDIDLLEGRMLMENTGNGEFLPSVTVVNSFNLSILATIDYDGDGDKDILSAEQTNTGWIWDIYVHENEGGNNFTDAVSLFTIGSIHNSIVVDVDEDGDEDLLIATPSGIELQLNDNGSFSAIAISTEAYTNLVVGDFNGDNINDILGASETDGEVKLLTGMVGNSWNAGILLTTTFATNEFRKRFSAADIDDDGDLDFTFGNNEDKLVWYENNDGSLTFDVHENSSSTLLFPVVDLVDLSGDGLVDILSNNPTASFYKMMWQKNNGAGDFGNIAPLAVQSFGNKTPLTDADLDGDGLNDIVAGLYYMKNLGDGNFGIPKRWISSYVFLETLHFEDFDDDGDLDFLTHLSNGNTRDIIWVKNDGEGNFSYDDVVEVGFVWYLISSMDAGDFDNDGDIDILVATDNVGLGTREVIKWYEQKNDGSHTYLGYEIDNNVRTNENVRAADIDGDGDIDFLRHQDYSTRIYWYENQGDMNFSDKILFTDDFHDDIQDFYLSDIDNDGDLDLLITSDPITSTADHHCSWYRNDGDDMVLAQTIYTDGPPTGIYNFDEAHLSIADMEGDGDIDVLVGSSSESELRWYLNDGNGDFSDSELIFSKDYVLFGEVHTMDVNNDGKFDAIAGYSPDSEATNLPYEEEEINNISWFRNESDFQPYIQLDNATATCNNNGTIGNGADDFIEIQLNIDGVGVDGSYSVTVNNGEISTNTGSYDQDETFVINQANAGNIVLTIMDSENSTYMLTTVIANPGSCSDYADYVTATISNISCVDNNTPTDPIDDYIEFKLVMLSNVLSGDYLVGIDGIMVSPTQNIYSNQATFTTQIGSAGTEAFIVTLSDASNPDLTIDLILENPGTCSNSVPSISASIESTSCNDNTTASDPSDDYITFDLNTTAEFLSNNYLISSNNGVVTPNSGIFGEIITFNLENGSAGNGDIIVTITDTINPDFSFETVVIDPGTCSVVGINNLKIENIKIAVSPNPFDEQTTFATNQLSNPEEYVIRLFDIGGRLQEVILVDNFGKAVFNNENDIKGTLIFQLQHQETKKVAAYGKLVAF